MRKPFYPCLLFFSLIAGLVNSAYAQKEANNWYFGSKAGLNFSTGAPVALTNGNLVTYEGCATISDKTTGNLLFYTDGTTVWNSQHNPMPNGTGLLGNSSSTQSAIAVPNPSNSNQYYIFTVDAQAGLDPPSTTGFGGLAYSIVDMTLDGGLGDLSIKNISLLTPTCEKLSAVRHCNGRDIWVVVHQWNTNAFYAYLVSPTGVAAPVITNIGIVHQDVGSGVRHEAAGYMKFSPDAKKLALVCYYDLNTMQFFDFDNSTGILSNAQTDNAFPPNLSGADGLYGLSFSPDNSKLYISWFGDGTYTDYLEGLYDSYLYQYNMLAGSGTAIVASKTLINSTAQFGYGAMQIGPDGKIYMAKTDRSNTTNGFSNYLDVINTPNGLGAACNFTSSGLYLGGAGVNQSVFGLPDIVESFLIPQYSATLSYNACSGNSMLTFTDTTLNGTITSLWNFGDPSSGTSDTSTQANATHNYSSSGTYTATLYLTNACKTDTLTQTIVIGSVSVSITVNNSASCGLSNGSATANPSGGNGTYTYAWNNSGSSVTVSNLSSGPCSVTVTDAGCSASATATIGSISGIVISTSFTNTSCGVDNGTAKVIVVSGTATAFAWSNQAHTDSISGLAPGPYSVTVTGTGGCTDTASVNITASGNASVTISTSTDTICSGDSAQICASSGYNTYSWNTNQTGQCIYAYDAGDYYLTATGAGGCTAESNHLSLSVYPVPSVSIVVQGDTLSSFGAVTYQWYLNGNSILGATSAVYIAHQSGNYSVLISDQNGCTALSSPVNVIATGITELQNNIQFNIYPNPISRGMMQIEISPQLMGQQYEIYDALGRLIIENVLTSQKSEVDVSLLNAGVYLVKLQGNVRRMIKE